MGLKKVVEEALKNMGLSLDTILSSKEKGRIIARLLGDNPAFQQEITKIVSRKAKTRKLVTKPAEAPKKMELVQMPAPAVPTPPPVAAPVSKPKPRWEGLFKALSSFVDGGRINFDYTRESVAEMIQSGFKLNKREWETLFAAMKRMEEKGSYLLKKEVDLPRFFRQAPEYLLDQYVFGLDGIMTSVISGLNAVEGQMSASLIAKTYVLVEALEVLELGVQEHAKVEELADRLEEVMGPRNLCKRVFTVLQRFQKEPESKRRDPRWQGDGSMADKLRRALVAS